MVETGSSGRSGKAKDAITNGWAGDRSAREIRDGHAGFAITRASILALESRLANRAGCVSCFRGPIISRHRIRWYTDSEPMNEILLWPNGAPGSETWTQLKKESWTPPESPERFRFVRSDGHNATLSEKVGALMQIKHTVVSPLQDVNKGAISRCSSNDCITVSLGRASSRLAASSTLGMICTSPAVQIKTPGRASAQWTALSMSA
jgi:hypothetical protein